MRTHWLSSLSLIKPSWICLTIDRTVFSPAAEADLLALGFLPLPDNAHCYAIKAADSWTNIWHDVYSSISQHGMENSVQVGIVPGDEAPIASEVGAHNKTIAETAEINAQMWLIDAIGDNRLICHFQPVVDRAGNIFGYESLVRAIGEDGNLINGGEIFCASRALRIEHLIDRHLHELAIKGYMDAGLTGFLFINLVPGFIQRPEFYFGGLTEAAKKYGMNAKNIALDFTKSETPRDIQHLKAITHYCRSQGYLVSLDDIESPQTAQRILNEMRPDFIKIDMRLVQRADQPEAMGMIRELVEMTHNTSSMLIAEGVETESIRVLLEQAGIGLYQGYLFSPPLVFPPDATPKKGTAAEDTSQQNRA